MTKEEVFSMWAPDGCPWSSWVKPVLFSHMNETIDPPATVTVAVDLVMIPKPTDHTAIVVDLPGDRSTYAGLALAALGYRPVPLYNAIPGIAESMREVASFSLRRTAVHHAPLVDMLPTLKILYHGAEALGAMPLRTDAPPAFLLHSNRAKSSYSYSSDNFDNRSIVTASDFPSPERLRESGIHRILVIQDSESRPQMDLYHILRRWQDMGLEIRIYGIDGGTNTPGGTTLQTPSRWERCWFAIVKALRFQRNRDGTFGHIVSQSG